MITLLIVICCIIFLTGQIIGGIGAIIGFLVFIGAVIFGAVKNSEWYHQKQKEKMRKNRLKFHPERNEE